MSPHLTGPAGDRNTSSSRAMLSTAADTGLVASPGAVKSSTPCRYFYRSGKCRRGEKCLFSHEQARQPGQPSTIPRLPSSPPPSTHLSALASEYVPNAANGQRLSACAKPFDPRPCSDDEAWVDEAGPGLLAEVTNALPTTGTMRTAAHSHSGSVNTQTCDVCFDVPPAYAQHPNCDHAFCPPCLREWRRQSSQVNVKSCPVCRTPSKYTFVTSQPFKGAARELAVRRFKERAAATPCTAFTKSLARSNKHAKPLCPFGDDCLFQHHIDGKPHKFGYGRLTVRARTKHSRRLVRPVARSERSIAPGFLQRIRDIDERILLLLAARPAH